MEHPSGSLFEHGGRSPRDPPLAGTIRDAMPRSFDRDEQRLRRHGIPDMAALEPHRYDSECYEVAASLASQWPHLKADAGFYVHPERGPGDHGWNVAPDGTIVDMTATQHDYRGPQDEPGEEPEQWPAPEHPEVIPPGHPFYDRYVSWTRHEPRAQEIAHGRGLHEQDPLPGTCPLC